MIGFRVGLTIPRATRILSHAELAMKVSHYSGTGPLLDINGRGYQAQFPGGGNNPLFMPFSGVGYIWFPGASGNGTIVPELGAGTLYWTRLTPDGTSSAIGTTTSNAVLVPPNGAWRYILRTGSHSGPIVADLNAAELHRFNATRTSYTDVYGNTWAINRSASGLKTALVDRPLLLFGLDKFLEIANAPGLNFGASDSLTVVVVGRRYGVSSVSSEPIISKQFAVTSASAGYTLYYRSAGNVGWGLADGVTSQNIAASGPDYTPGAISVMAGVVDRRLETRRVTVNGVDSSFSVAIGSLVNSHPLRVARFTDTGTAYADFELFGFALFRTALSDAEIQRAGQELLQ